MNPQLTQLRYTLPLLVALCAIAPCGAQSQNGAGSPAASAAKDGSIPARPEQLAFPPLKYEPPVPAEYRVVLKTGSIAYIVPDHELPLVNISVLVRTGEYVDPAGKEGLADLTGFLMARGGTKSWTASELEEKLAFLAAQLGSGVNDTRGTVSLNLLSKDLDQGLSILRETLSTPRFEESRIALRKQQLFQEMQQRNDDSSSIEGREVEFLAYGEQFWVNQYTTAASLKAVTKEDLESFHKRFFYPSNFVLAVSGDFDRDQMLSKLEQLFSDWPFQGETAPPIPTNTVFAQHGAYIVDKDVNQGRVAIMLPGIKRENPDYFTAFVMNDILGGGGFTSRIMNRVRSDEGLAYSAYSAFPGGVYYPLTFTAGFQSKSRTVAYAASIVLEEMKKIAAEPVTDQELETSKRGLIDRFPRIFASKVQVAATFADDEFTGRYARDPEFWKNYRARVEAVGKEDVLRVAKKYLDPEKAVILVVGQRDQVLLGYPGHDVKLADLGGGRLVDLPLRDPLTMKPMDPQPKKESLTR